MMMMMCQSVDSAVPLMSSSLAAIDEHKRPDAYDKTADIAFSKGDTAAVKAGDKDRLQRAGTVSKFGGLVSTGSKASTADKDKEQAYLAQTTTGKVTDFSGLRTSTRKIVTADAAEQKRIEQASVVKKKKSMFSNLGKQASVVKKPSVQLDQSMKDSAKDAKNVFKRMEKQTTLDNVNKKRAKKGKGKKRKSVLK